MKHILFRLGNRVYGIYIHTIQQFMLLPSPYVTTFEQEGLKVYEFGIVFTTYRLVFNMFKHAE